MKICGTCKIEKDISEFSKNRNSKDGINDRCIECTRITRLRADYNISKEDYEFLLKKQNGLCAGCGEPPIDGKSLDVDHIKDTNPIIIRGLLHKHCNVAIGYANHDPELLAKLILYLKNHHNFIGTNTRLKGQKYAPKDGRQYKGVSILPHGKYRAVIKNKSESIHLGMFNYPEQAAIAYDNAALKLFGPNTYLNNIDSNWTPPISYIKGKIYKVYGKIKFKGVAYNHGKYSARISLDKEKSKYLGNFAYPEQAALAYNKAALEAFGPDTFLNNVDPNWTIPEIDDIADEI